MRRMQQEEGAASRPEKATNGRLAGRVEKGRAGEQPSFW